jgi:hypothetical protein
MVLSILNIQVGSADLWPAYRQDAGAPMFAIGYGFYVRDKQSAVLTHKTLSRAGLDNH